MQHAENRTLSKGQKNLSHGQIFFWARGPLKDSSPSSPHPFCPASSGSVQGLRTAQGTSRKLPVQKMCTCKKFVHSHRLKLCQIVPMCQMRNLSSRLFRASCLPLPRWAFAQGSSCPIAQILGVLPLWHETCFFSTLYGKAPYGKTPYKFHYHLQETTQ